MTYREIREAKDVLPEHIEYAAEMREGCFGGSKLDWMEVIDKLESSDEDWGSNMLSPAIKHLKREVNRRLREQA